MKHLEVCKERRKNMPCINLKGEMAKKDITIEEISKLLKIHRNSVANKLNGDSAFTIDEAFEIQKKYKKVFLNPLLISIVLVIVVLLITGVSYETYQYGAKYLSYFLLILTTC